MIVKTVLVTSVLACAAGSLTLPAPRQGDAGQEAKAPSGHIVVDEDPSKSSVEIEIDAASIDSNSERRDAHLKNQDFFSVKEFPKVTFKSTKVEQQGDGWQITGDLTMRGVTKSIQATAERTGIVQNKGRFGTRIGYSVDFTVKRSEFGINYGIEQGAIGDEVQVMCGIQVIVPGSGR